MSSNTVLNGVGELAGRQINNLGVFMKSLLSLCVLLSLAGCSYRGAYDSLQASNRMACSKLPPSQYNECVERTQTSYDEYERERQETLSR
jgi:hypothetical protein